MLTTRHATNTPEMTPKDLLQTTPANIINQTTRPVKDKGGDSPVQEGQATLGYLPSHILTKELAQKVDKGEHFPHFFCFQKFLTSPPPPQFTPKIVFPLLGGTPPPPPRNFSNGTLAESLSSSVLLPKSDEANFHRHPDPPREIPKNITSFRGCFLCLHFCSLLPSGVWTKVSNCVQPIRCRCRHHPAYRTMLFLCLCRQTLPRLPKPSPKPETAWVVGPTPLLPVFHKCYESTAKSRKQA